MPQQTSASVACGHRNFCAGTSSSDLGLSRIVSSGWESCRCSGVFTPSTLEVGGPFLCSTGNGEPHPLGLEKKVTSEQTPFCEAAPNRSAQKYRWRSSLISFKLQVAVRTWIYFQLLLPQLAPVPPCRPPGAQQLQLAPLPERPPLPP